MFEPDDPIWKEKKQLMMLLEQDETIKNLKALPENDTKNLDVQN